MSLYVKEHCLVRLSEKMLYMLGRNRESAVFSHGLHKGVTDPNLDSITSLFVYSDICQYSLKELGTSRTHSAVIRCLTICQHIPVVRKNHKNQLTQQFDIICCLARGLALCIKSKQIMSLLSCESATLKRGPQLRGQRCGPYLRH